MPVGMSIPTMDFNTPLSTLQIQHGLNTMMLDRALVLARNCIPRCVEQFPSVFIINQDDSFSPGSHWTVVYFPYIDSLVEYFDSLGNPPPSDKNHIYNATPLQSLLSSICGHYCLLFVYYRTKLGFSMKQFVENMKRKSEREIFTESFNLFFREYINPYTSLSLVKHEPENGSA